MFERINLFERHITLCSVDCISNCSGCINEGVIGIGKLCTTLPFFEELNEVHRTFNGISYKGIYVKYLYLYTYILDIYLHVIPTFTCKSLLVLIQSTTGSCVFYVSC